MKNKAIEIAALILGLLTTVAGVLTLPQVALLPQEWQPFVALSLALVVVGKNAAYVVLDFCDDGQLNKSYKLPPGLHALLLCGLLLITLPSCGTAPDGQRTFAGLTLPQGLQIGERVLRREAADNPQLGKLVRVLDDAKAVTSAKQPVNIEPQPTN